MGKQSVVLHCPKCGKYFNYEVSYFGFFGITLGDIVVQAACPHCGAIASYEVTQ